MPPSDLGLKDSEAFPSFGMDAAKPSDKVNYPGLTLRGKQMDASGIETPHVGQTITATVTMSVSSVSKDSCQLDVKTIDVTSQEDAGDEEASGDDNSGDASEMPDAKPKKPKDFAPKKMPSPKDILS